MAPFARRRGVKIKTVFVASAVLLFSGFILSNFHLAYHARESGQRRPRRDVCVCCDLFAILWDLTLKEKRDLFTHTSE